jgi:hypothetical protein
MNNQNHCENCQYNINKLDYLYILNLDLQNQLENERHRIRTVDSILVKMKTIIQEIEDIKSLFVNNDI